LTCDMCGLRAEYPSDHRHPEHDIGGVPMNIWTPTYDLPDRLKPDESNGAARFRDYIPFEISDTVLDDEGDTPLEEVCENVYLKDESTNPTKSFKDRGMVVMVSDAIFSGKRKIAIPSTGNAAISLGYYAERAGLEPISFIPKGTSARKMAAIKEHSDIICDDGLVTSYEHFFDFCRAEPSVYNGFPVTNIPYNQGLKTIAYEIFLQMGRIPEFVVVPVGSGGNIVAQYTGFNDLIQMGVTDRMPRLISVQVSGADPVNVGFVRRQFNEVVLLDRYTESKAEAIASDTCFNYFKIMRALDETLGEAISITDQEIDDIEAYDSFEYSSRSVFAALRHLKQSGGNREIVLIGTAGEKN